MNLNFTRPLRVPVKANYAPYVDFVEAAKKEKLSSDAQKLLAEVESFGKRRQAGLLADLDEYASQAWFLYNVRRSKPHIQQTRADVIRWAIRCWLVRWRII